MQQEEADRRFELAQLFEVRIALESTATSLAAINATDEEINLIVDAFEAHRAARPSDVAGLVRTDELFHGRIVEASHNAILTSMYRTLIPELRAFREDCFNRGVAKQSSDGHDLVVQFLKNGDEAGARTAMTSHLLTFASRLRTPSRVSRRYS